MTGQKLRQGKPSTRWLGCCAALALFGPCVLSATAYGAAVIVNEFNAVASSKYLGGGDYEDALDPIKEDAYFGTIPGLPDGRIEGNGGNWVELIVVQDHLDFRGYQLRWAETDASDTDGNDLWYGDSNIEQGVISFSGAADVWSDLRAGTIITISEKDAIGVDTDWDGTNRNFTNNVSPGDVDVVIDLSTDTSFDPAGGDWWIHVSSRGELGQPNPLITTVTNVNGDGPGDFSVGDADWQLTVVDANLGHVFGPVGEDIANWGGGGVSDKEAGRLEIPRAQDNWDLNDWNSVGVTHYDDATSTTFGQPNAWGTPEEPQDLSALRALIPEPGTIVMLLSAAVSLVLFWRRRRAAHSS